MARWVFVVSTILVLGVGLLRFGYVSEFSDEVAERAKVSDQSPIVAAASPATILSRGARQAKVRGQGRSLEPHGDWTEPIAVSTVEEPPAHIGEPLDADDSLPTEWCEMEQTTVNIGDPLDAGDHWSAPAGNAVTLHIGPDLDAEEGALWYVGGDSGETRDIGPPLDASDAQAVFP